MTTIQDYGYQPSAGNDGSSQNFDLAHIIGIIKRRALYFTIPFLVAIMAGVAIIEIQRPIYRSQGEILVESPAIPPDLVHPTITELPDERFEVIKQRIMANDNLSAIINKYDLFPKARGSLPEFRLIDLMRTRVLLTPVPLEMSRAGSITTAFTVSFDYEVPSVALQVASHLIDQILSQDTSRRTTNATEAAQFLKQEVKRLQQEHDAVVARLEAIRQRPPDRKQAVSEEAKAQVKALAVLQQELVEKSMVYSDEYPVIKELKKKIAALKQAIASEPQAAVIAVDDPRRPDIGTQVLEQQELNLEKNLNDANQKLAAALLGESMEKNQQAEHLQLIASPDLAHDPVRPKKLKLLAVALALAGMIGAASLFAAEMLDRSIHRTRELAAIVDPHLIVTLPYISTPGEDRQRRRNFVLICLVLVTGLAIVIAIAVAKGLSFDFARLIP
jgi:hypothetical protein